MARPLPSHRPSLGLMAWWALVLLSLSALMGVSDATAEAPRDSALSEAWTSPLQAAPSVHGGPSFLEVLPPAIPVRTRIDGDQLLHDLSVLAHDSMEGRRTGSPGNERARRFILERLDDMNVPGPSGGRIHEFHFTNQRDGRNYRGLNLMAMVEGTRNPEEVFVLTAHYDHLGVVDDEIFNGADDNASGTAALLSLAHYFLTNPTEHSILFLFTDAEEMGLQGARAFIADPPLALDRVIMNINLDMVSRNEEDELYAVGTYHYPFLVDLVDEVASDAPVELLRGHDTPDLPPGEDWTMASDHGPFHEVGIPFVYFGVEDHPGYHHPSDTFDAITPDFFVRAVETILDFVIVADREGEMIRQARAADTVGGILR